MLFPFMGMNGAFEVKNYLIPEIETMIQQTRTMEESKITESDVHDLRQTSELKNQKMSVSDYIVAFSGISDSFCIGLVDMCDSTRISANLNERDWCRYYSIFLNSAAKILARFGGQIIKNGGDSLLYYFPESNKLRYGCLSCLEFSLALVESQKFISKKIQEEGLPSLNFRVSSDYGKVIFMKSNNSVSLDVIGPPVNMCSKINHRATSNSVVIGGDLYQMVKDQNDYRFTQIPGFSIGLKYTYPIYALTRRKQI